MGFRIKRVRNVLLRLGLLLCLLVSTASPGWGTLQPSAGNVTTSALPEGLASASSVWDPGVNKAYVFGGVTMLDYSCDPARPEQTGDDCGWNRRRLYDDVLSFDPTTKRVSLLTAKLPSPRYATAAVWVGSVAYVIGGFTGSSTNPYSDEIVRFDPRDLSMQVVARLPKARAAVSAVWTGSDILIMGGVKGYGGVDGQAPPVIGSQTNAWADSDFLDEVVRFNPAASNALIPPVLSSETGFGSFKDVQGGSGARAWSSAVYFDGYAYLFGGFDNTSYPWGGYGVEDLQGVGPGHQILKIGPTGSIGAMTITRMQSPLAYQIDSNGRLGPNRFGRYGTSAAVFGGSAYIFGGCCVDGHPYRYISKFDFASDKITTAAALPVGPAVPATQPAGPGADLGLMNFGMAVTGNTAYLFGGNSLSGPSTQIQSYTEGGQVSTVSKVLPWEDQSMLSAPRSMARRTGAAAVSAGKYAYMFGGDNMQNRFDQIVRLDTTTGEASALPYKLPQRLSGIAASWDPRPRLGGCTNGCAYLFGGFTQSRGFTDAIYRFSPEQGIKASSTKLMEPRVGAAAVTDGPFTYLIGGSAQGIFLNVNGAQVATTPETNVNFGPSKVIYRYNADGDVIAPALTKLPLGLTAASAVFVRHSGVCLAGCIYIIGGQWSSKIFRYIPALDGTPAALTEMSTHLDRFGMTGLWGASVVTDGSLVYIYGGVCCGRFGARGFDSVLSYDPAADTPLTLDGITPAGPSMLKLVDRMPTSRWNAPAVCGDRTVDVIGGSYERVRLGSGDSTYYFRSDTDRDYHWTEVITRQALPPAKPLSLLPVGLPKPPATPADSTLDRVLLALFPSCSTTLEGVTALVYQVKNQSEAMVGSATGTFSSASQIEVPADSCVLNQYRIELQRAGESSVSSKVSAIALDPPKIATSSRLIDGSVSLGWSVPSCGQPVTYRIYRIDNAGTSTLIKDLPGNVTSYVDATASGLANFAYRITAVQRIGGDNGFLYESAGSFPAQVS